MYGFHLACRLFLVHVGCPPGFRFLGPPSEFGVFREFASVILSMTLPIPVHFFIDHSWCPPRPLFWFLAVTTKGRSLAPASPPPTVGVPRIAAQRLPLLCMRLPPPPGVPVFLPPALGSGYKVGGGRSHATCSFLGPVPFPLLVGSFTSPLLCTSALLLSCLFFPPAPDRELPRDRPGPRLP